MTCLVRAYIGEVTVVRVFIMHNYEKVLTALKSDNPPITWYNHELSKTLHLTKEQVHSSVRLLRRKGYTIDMCRLGRGKVSYKLRTKPMIVNAIVAVGNQGQIGFMGNLPWHDPQDLNWFKNLTMDCVCIAGHNTYMTLPHLSGRMVLEDNTDMSPEDYLASLGITEVWIIGGAKTYARYAHLIDRWHIGKIDYSGDADTFFDFNLIGKPKR